MKRIIKFRAWDSGLGRWHNPKDVGSDRTPRTPIRKILKYDAKDGTMNLYNHEDFIWMQFTGLYDRNGKEIYEGDVVLVPNMDYDPSEGDNPMFIKQVFYFAGGFGVDIKEEGQFEYLHEYWVGGVDAGNDQCREHKRQRIALQLFCAMRERLFSRATQSEISFA